MRPGTPTCHLWVSNSRVESSQSGLCILVRSCGRARSLSGPCATTYLYPRFYPRQRLAGGPRRPMRERERDALHCEARAKQESITKSKYSRRATPPEHRQRRTQKRLYKHPPLLGYCGATALRAVPPPVERSASESLVPCSYHIPSRPPLSPKHCALLCAPCPALSADITTRPAAHRAHPARWAALSLPLTLVRRRTSDVRPKAAAPRTARTPPHPGSARAHENISRRPNNPPSSARPSPRACGPPRGGACGASTPGGP